VTKSKNASSVVSVLSFGLFLMAISLYSFVISFFSILLSLLLAEIPYLAVFVIFIEVMTNDKWKIYVKFCI